MRFFADAQNDGERRLLLAHEIQLVNYLVATRKPIGLLLNFAERKVEVKRKVREFKQG